MVSAQIVQVFVVLLALTGLIIAHHIWRKKRTGQTLVCPINANCEAVIHSEYAHFLGIPVELLGMAYYSLIAIAYAVFLLIPNLAQPITVFAILAITTAAFLFSIYLTFIQLFAIREWCTWCLTSAGICSFIFLGALTSADYNFIPLLAANYQLLIFGHLLGVIMGFGGAIITDLLSLKFLRDGRMKESEADVLHTISQVIWLALAIILLTGAGLFLPQVDQLLQSSKFLVKMTIVAVIITNGSLFRFVVEPRLLRIFSPEEPGSQPAAPRSLRRLAFALGGISSSSWMSAFVLGLLPHLPYTYPQVLVVYLAVLAGAVISTQLAEYRFTAKTSQSSL
jgi:uncharacterized membrane protein